MTDPNRVNPAGKFVTHRDLSGAPAAESSTLNDTNFPPADALHCAGAKAILVYYDDAGGGAGTVDLQPLVRDGINNIWLPLPVVQVAGRAPQVIPVHGANQVFLRLDAVAGAGNDVKVRAALADWMNGPSR